MKGRSAAPSAKRVPEETNTPEDLNDASDIDGDTFEHENNVSDTENEPSEHENDDASTTDDGSLEKSSKRSEIDNVASNGDLFEEGGFKRVLRILEVESNRKLLAACICNNSHLLEEAIGALDTKNTASEEVTTLIEKLTLHSARLGNLDMLDIFLAYMKDHLINTDEFINKFIDELETARSTTTMRLEIFNILIQNEFAIGRNPKGKRSTLELLIAGFDFSPLPLDY